MSLPDCVMQLATSERDIEVLVRLYDDPLFFLRTLWEDRKLHRHSPLDDLEIAAFLHACGNESRGKTPRNRGILAFRGVGKTRFGTSVLCVRRWFRDPHRQIIVPSKNIDAARKTGSMIRAWLDNVWFLQHLAPAKGQRDNLTMFDVRPVGQGDEDRQASFTAIGIGGQLENNRAHSIYPDDVETKSNTKTLEARMELRRLVKEFTNILYPYRPYENGGPIDPVELVYFGTPKHEESLYTHLAKPRPEGPGYKFYSFPIRYPTPDQNVINLAPVLKKKLETGKAKPGDPTTPLRFPEEEILNREAEGYEEFARESMLIADLADSNRYPIRLSDLIVMDVDRDRAPVRVVYGTSTNRGSTAIEDIECLGWANERLYAPVMIDDEWAPYSATVGWVDPSGRGNDYTGVAAVSALGGLFFIKGAISLGGWDASDKEGGKRHFGDIIRFFRRHGVQRICIETNNDVYGTYLNTFESFMPDFILPPGEDADFPDGWKASVESRHNTAQKELRIIETIEPLSSTHRLVVHREAIRPQEGVEVHATLQFQLSRITNQRKCLREDGVADAVAGAINELRHMARKAPERAGEKVRHLEAQKQLHAVRDQMLRAIGREPRKPNWIRGRR